MGKGTIISGGENGQYQVQVNYGRDGFTSDIAALTTKKDELAQEIIDEGLKADPDTDRLNSLKLQKMSIEKKIDSLQADMPDDETVSAWCADLTEDLSGEVGTVEVPGEVGTIQIQPGYDGNAVYDSTRDGQLLPTVVNSPAQAFYNIAMLPGWQMWKPTFRYGTVTAVDQDADTADVDLEAAISSQQSLEINQTATLSDVPIDYMDCDSLIFAEGDEVLIKFENQDWASPKIVGFKDHPKPCATGYFIVKTQANAGDSTYCIVWDLGRNALANDVTDNSSVLVTSWPVDVSTISTWIAARDDVGTDCVDSEVLTYLGTGGFPTDYLPAGQDLTWQQYELPDDFTCHAGSPCSFATAYQEDEINAGAAGEKGYMNWDWLGGRCGNPAGATQYIYDGSTYNHYEYETVEQIVDNVTSPVHGVNYDALVNGISTENRPNIQINRTYEYYYQENNSYDCFSMTESPYETDGDIHTYWHAKIEWDDPFLGAVSYEPSDPGSGSNQKEWHFVADGLYGNEDCPFCIVIACKCLKIMPPGIGDPLVDMPLTYYARSKAAGDDESGNPANLNPYQLNENAALGEAVQDLVEWVDSEDGYPETSWSAPHGSAEGIIQPGLTLQLLEKEAAV